MKSKKLVYDVGVNDADYPLYWKADGKQKSCPYYQKWTGMLQRSYSSKLHEKYPTYIGCKVHPDWHRLSTFKAWMELQDWEGMHLDKDIIFQGNKVYSPETCVFVTAETNLFLTDSAAARGDLPIGVYFKQRRSPYQAGVRVKGKVKYLGSYSTPEEAHQAWRVAKWELAVQLASEQSDPRVAAALIERYKL